MYFSVTGYRDFICQMALSHECQSVLYHVKDALLMWEGTGCGKLLVELSLSIRKVVNSCLALASRVKPN
jgi:hypothetical protein